MSNFQTNNPSIHTNCTCIKANSIYITGQTTCKNLYELSQTQEFNKEDLLRAVLLFACSTLDSASKQLAKDCLGELIDVDGGAQKTFEDYISRQIDKDARKILARALSKPDYRGELITIFKESIEGKSLQSYPQISELTSRFGIPTANIIDKTEAEKIFDIRQKIVHEMDIDIVTTANGNATQRRTRAENELKESAESILNATCNLIQMVHNKIHERTEDIRDIK